MFYCILGATLGDIKKAILTFLTIVYNENINFSNRELIYPGEYLISIQERRNCEGKKITLKHSCSSQHFLIY